MSDIGRPPFLLIAHPGHELALHGWIEQTSPKIFILTDGSGRTGVSRVGFSRDLIARAGGRVGSIFGSHSDLEIYRAMLDGNGSLFVGLARELASEIAAHRPPLLIHDPYEGYNPTHDLCRWIAGAAIENARRVAGHSARQLEFTLEDEREPGVDSSVLTLTDAALERKLHAAGEYTPLASEVDSNLAKGGAEYFRHERFGNVARWHDATLPGDNVARYERFGAERVESGAYDHVIRLRDHMRPILRGLEGFAKGEEACDRSASSSSIAI